MRRCGRGVCPRASRGYTGATMEPLPSELPMGAIPLGDGRARFRVWAPTPEDVRLRVGGREHALQPLGMGAYEAIVEAQPGEDYVYVIDGVELPDPASRWQPEGLRGPSRLLDTGAFAWTDDGFAPPPLRDSVLYELHIGTFTPDGTFDAAIERLPALRELGVTTLEVMPIAEFPGRHGWG